MPYPLPARLVIAACAASLLIGCSQGPSEAAKPPEMPSFADEHLSEGRSVWIGTCRNCHLLGVAGAPAVTDFAAWEQRLEKGMDALYRTALDGVKDPDGVYLKPPRGGNTRLTDDQLRAAVDYEVAAVKALREASQH